MTTVANLCLGALSDPKQFTGAISIDGIEQSVLTKYLKQMLLIRYVEEQIADWVVAGEVGTPCHLGIGQEAAAVGVAAMLNKNDRVFGGHRSHSQYLAMGGSVEALLAEVLGRATGASKGMGGSMHLYAGEVGFHGSVPIVAATISISVGAALAAKLDGSDNVSACFFGDGAAEEGVLHESLNLAASQELPVIFVCENNLFSSHLDIHIRQPGDRVARFADAHKVAALSVDGNDVVAVQKATESLVTAAREGSKPGFLELVTYRHRGHVGPNEDIDVGVNRTMSDLHAWKHRDPIRRLVDAMQQNTMITEERIADIDESIRMEVAESSAKALAAPFPDDNAMFSGVYAKVSS